MRPQHPAQLRALIIVREYYAALYRRELVRPEERERVHQASRPTLSTFEVHCVKAFAVILDDRPRRLGPEMCWIAKDGADNLQGDVRFTMILPDVPLVVAIGDHEFQSVLHERRICRTPR